MFIQIYNFRVQEPTVMKPLQSDTYNDIKKWNLINSLRQNFYQKCSLCYGSLSVDSKQHTFLECGSYYYYQLKQQMGNLLYSFASDTFFSDIFMKSRNWGQNGQEVANQLQLSEAQDSIVIYLPKQPQDIIIRRYAVYQPTMFAQVKKYLFSDLPPM